jgi:hypothetical protein
MTCTNRACARKERAQKEAQTDCSLYITFLETVRILLVTRNIIYRASKVLFQKRMQKKNACTLCQLKGWMALQIHECMHASMYACMHLI